MGPNHHRVTTLREVWLGFLEGVRTEIAGPILRVIIVGKSFRMWDLAPSSEWSVSSQASYSRMVLRNNDPEIVGGSREVEGEADNLLSSKRLRDSRTTTLIPFLGDICEGQLLYFNVRLGLKASRMRTTSRLSLSWHAELQKRVVLGIQG